MRAAIVLVLLLVTGIALWSSTKPSQGEPSAVALRAELAAEGDSVATLDPGLARGDGRTGAVIAEVVPDPSSDVEPAARRVLVEAVFEDGSPISRLPIYASIHAPLDASPAIGPTWRRVFTDAAGRASLELPPSCALELATQLDDEEAPTRVESDAPHETRIVIRRPRPPLVVFHGRITNLRGHSVAGARAIAACEIASNEAEIALPSDVGIVAACDANGLFRLELEPWRSVFARVEAPGLSQRTLELTRGHESPDDALVIQLPAAGSLAFRAEDAAQSPLAGAVLRVTCGAAGDTTSGHGDGPFDVAYPRLAWSATLDSEGRATITELPVDRGLALTLSADGRVLRRAPNEGWLEHGESRELVWRIGTGARVTGQLVDEHGRGISEHEMWLIGDPYDQLTDVLGARTRERATATSFTSANGSFLFEDVTPGKWKVAPRPCIAEKDPHFFYPRLVPVQLAAGVGEAHVVVRIGLQTFIEGVVLDPDGSPAERAEVEARNLAFAPVTTNAAGRFRIGPLPPGACELSARVRDGRHASSGWIAVDAPSDSVELRLRRSAVLAGRVSGLEHGVADVRLTGLDGIEADDFVAARDGLFRFSGLAAGRYRLRASTRDDEYLMVPRIVELAAGEARMDCEVRLEACGRMRFVGGALGETRWVSVHVGGDRWSTTEVLVGRTVEVRVPPGETTLRVLDAEDTEIGARAIEVVPGSTIEVDVHALGG